MRLVSIAAALKMQGLPDAVCVEIIRDTIMQEALEKASREAARAVMLVSDHGVRDWTTEAERVSAARHRRIAGENMAKMPRKVIS